MASDSNPLRYFLVTAITLLIVFSTSSLIFTYRDDQNQDVTNFEISTETELISDIELKESDDGKIERDTVEMNNYEPDEERKLYVEYDESYRTRDYNVWKQNEEYDKPYTSDVAVVRRGSTLELNAPPDASIEIEPAEMDMTSLEEDEGVIDIPEDSTIGIYTIDAEGEGWKDSMDLFIIYDPWAVDLPEDELRAYAYDEESVRADYSYIYTTGGQLQPGRLRAFGEDRKEMEFPDMYEFALRAVSGAEDQREAAIRLLRIVAQRNEAVPSPFEDQPHLRDAGTILFGRGESTLHGEEYRVTGLTTEDAEILAENDKSVPGIDGLTDEGESKIINGWCDETAFALTGLLRSIGIPSRVVSVHPDEEVTELMGHFMNEVYFEESLFETSGEEERNGEGWYVMDADSWNAEWYVQRQFNQPIFWMPMGELYTSRRNFNRAAETLFRVNYEYEVDRYYVPPTELPVPPAEITDHHMKDVTSQYKENSHFDLEGPVEKYAGRGGGDYFRVEVEDLSQLSISRSGGTNPRLYVNQEDYPALKITHQGYPPRYPNGNLTDDEVILDEGTYYIGVYAPEEKDENLEGKPYEGHHLPEHGDPSLIGNYGKYELTLERVEDKTPATEPESITEVEEDLDGDTLHLDWEEPDDGGSRINHYVVYRDGKELARVEKTHYVDQGLEEDENYYYNITAVNFMGQSEKLRETTILISTHEYPVYEERFPQFITGLSLLVLWVGSYFVMKELEGSSR